MKHYSKKSGFSLVEVMMAAGIMMIAFVFIAGTFPVGMKLTATTTERTIAQIAISEAANKIKLYGVGTIPNTGGCVPYNISALAPDTLNRLITKFLAEGVADIAKAIDDLLIDESLYPSTDTATDKKYCWSALCRATGGAGGEVQIMIFVSRVTNNGLSYPYSANPADSSVPTNLAIQWPKPIKRSVTDDSTSADNRLENPDKNMVFEGSILVNDATGQQFLVVSTDTDGDYIILDNDYPATNDDVWFIPPAIGTTRNPCIAVNTTMILVP